jgi:predicted oxidoreductase
MSSADRSLWSRLGKTTRKYRAVTTGRGFASTKPAQLDSRRIQIAGQTSGVQSLIQRTVERQLVPMAKALKLGVLAWSPLANGVLTGKYHSEGKAQAGRMSRHEMQQFLPEGERTRRIVSALKSVSGQTGRSMAQVALGWLRFRAVPVIPIIGARKVSQLHDNLASIDLELSDEQVKSLDEASRIELGYPYDLYNTGMLRAFAYGRMRGRIVA